MVTNPIFEVLHIPELIQLILSHLGYHDLVSARRTSKHFCKIVNGSSLLRRVLFRDPCPKTTVIRWSGNAEPDFSFENLLAEYRELPYNQELLRFAGHPVIVETSATRSGDLIVSTMNPVFEDAKWSEPPCSMVSFRFDITELHEFIAQDAAREEMLICQPPASIVELTVDHLPWDGNDDTRPEALDEPFERIIVISGRNGDVVRLSDLQRHYRDAEEKRAGRLDDECLLRIKGHISERSRWMAVARGEMKVDNLHRLRLGAGWL